MTFDIVNVLPLLVGGISSFLIGMLLERYKNRRIELLYNISYQKIGIPNDAYFNGKIKVLYNEGEANTLYFFKIAIKNNSNFDSKELPVNLNCDIDSYIVSHSYSKIPETTEINISKGYQEKFNSYMKNVRPILNQNINAEIQEPDFSNMVWIHKNINFVASSLNRNDEMEFTVLVGSNIDNHQPMMFLNIPTSGVKLTYAEDPIKTNEKVGSMSILLGIITTLLLAIYFIVKDNMYSTQFITITIYGSFNFIIGYIIFRIAHFIRSYFK